MKKYLRTNNPLTWLAVIRSRTLEVGDKQRYHFGHEDAPCVRVCVCSQYSYVSIVNHFNLAHSSHSSSQSLKLCLIFGRLRALTVTDFRGMSAASFEVLGEISSSDVLIYSVVLFFSVRLFLKGIFLFLR